MQWRLYEGSHRREMVRWYYTKADAKTLPYYFRTILLPWDQKGYIPTHIGPVGSDSFWDNGGNRGYDGKCLPEPAVWYMEGQPVDQEYSGVQCCAPTVHGSGGVGVGGGGRVCLGTEDLRDILVEGSDRCISPYGP